MPPEWRKLCHQPLSCTGWIIELARRLAQLQRICARETTELFQFGSAAQAIALGGLFFPEAFVAGTRQWIAQQSGVSLEQLELSVAIEDDARAAEVADCNSFVFSGLWLSSASWVRGALCAVADGVATALPPVRLRWLAPQPAHAPVVTLKTPVYQDRTRAEFLFSLELPIDATLSVATLVQRGVALLVFSPSKL